MRSFVFGILQEQDADEKKIGVEHFVTMSATNRQALGTNQDALISKMSNIVIQIIRHRNKRNVSGFEISRKRSCIIGLSF